jgi:hypothetical protein
MFLELSPMEFGEDTAESEDMDSHPVLFDRGGTDRPPLGFIGPHRPPDIDPGVEDDA